MQTYFQDNTWNRRLFRIDGTKMYGWRYPEDVDIKPPSDEFNIRHNTSCEKDSSIRLYGIKIDFDQSGSHIMFAADSDESQEIWIQKINTVVENIQLWS